MKLTVQKRLVLILVATTLLSVFLLLGLFQMAKGARFHYLNSLHLKHVLELTERVGVAGGVRPQASDLRQVVADIRTQPVECLKLIGGLDRMVMRTLETDAAIRLCEEDIALADRLLVSLDRHAAGQLGQSDLLAQMRDALRQFGDHSDRFLEPIAKTTEFILSATLLLFSALAAAILVSTVALARGIARTVHDMARATRALEESERRNRMLAYFDTLSGLPNRNLFLDRLEQAMALTQRNGGRLALMFIDLDRFKAVNDTHGHVAGDELLRQAGNRILKAVRASATVARLGGDEFTIVLHGATPPELVAARVAEKVLAAVGEPFELGNDHVFLSASIGITIFPQDALDSDTLLRNADMAMYKAKAGGRNRFEFYSKELDLSIQRRLRIEHALRGAVGRGETQLHYQPVVALDGLRVVGAEALMRWHHPGIGAIAPDQFIPMAEETGHIIEIGRWALDQACRQCCIWRELQGDQFRVAINVSVCQLRAGRFAQDLADALARHRLPPAALDVEVTESQMLEDDEASIAALNELARMGVRLLLDDFGKGYSSFGYLHALPFDILKIDRSFMTDSQLARHGRRDVVASMIAMAHQMGMQVVAEGVDSRAALCHLLAHGCDLAQGYYLGNPVPADQFRFGVSEAVLA